MIHAGAVTIPPLEWWQALAAIIGAFGLSPAPWILGLAFGRLQFSAPAERQTAALVKTLNDAHTLQLSESDAGWQRSYDELKESRDTYKLAWETERDGRAAATEQLADVAKAAGHAAATTVAAVTDAALKPKEGGA